jgi:hypothetical protein
MKIMVPRNRSELKERLLAAFRFDELGIDAIRERLGLTKGQATGVALTKVLGLLVEDKILTRLEGGRYRVRQRRGTHVACARKLRWDTRAKGKRFAEIDDKRKGVKTRVYRCPDCNGWHRTSQPAATKAKRPPISR